MAHLTAHKSRSAKGELARKNLKQAALVVLERLGYHQMRISDVTAEAGVATGLFYHYFPDLKSLSIEVLSDFVANANNVQDIEKHVPKGDWYKRIYAHNYYVVKTYATKPGLMRSLFQLADVDADFSKQLKSFFVEQLNWLAKLMPRLFPEAKITEHQALLVLYTLSGSSEVLLRDYFIHQDKSLIAPEMSVEAISELLSVMFYRGLFLQNPAAENLRHTAYFEQMQRVTLTENPAT